MKQSKKNKLTKAAILCISLASLAMSCSSDKQSDNEIPVFDVSKSYPEKVISLTDIADVSYVYLNSDSDDYLFKGTISYVTQNNIVVIDRSSQSILFFSKDGVPKSRFNRKGQGPEEFSSTYVVMYDEDRDDTYVFPDFSDHIMVYSSIGEFKRRINLPQTNVNGQMALYDDKSILVYDSHKLMQRSMASLSDNDKGTTLPPIDSTFYLISNIDGEVLEHIDLISKSINLTYKDPNSNFIGHDNYGRIRKAPQGFLLYNPENDTIFLYDKNKTLSPYIHKTPLLSESKVLTVMDIAMDAEKHQFLVAYPHSQTGKYPSSEYYMREKDTGEIYQYKLTLEDYQGKELTINPRQHAYYEYGYHFDLDFTELEEAYGEGKLSGELEELVASIIEKEDEASNVFVFVDFHR